MPLVVPDTLRHSVAGADGGPSWLERLPTLVARAVRRWGLELAQPFGDGMAAWTAPGTVADGTEVVLKIAFPDDEARSEAAALRAWGGRGAVRLLDDHAQDRALLMPRLRPGTTLRDAGLPPADHLAVGARVLRRTALVDVADPTPFRTVTVVAERLAELTAERAARLAADAPVPLDPGLCRHAVDLLRTLPHEGGPSGLVHGDLNPGNILRTGGATSVPDDHWVAIDPKPLHGDRAWDPWPLLTQVADWVDVTAPPAELAERTRLVADLTGLDAARIAAWCVARSVEAGLGAADRGWWRGFRGADGDLARGRAWERAALLLGAG